MSKIQYETDFYAWLTEQAGHLRGKQWEALDTLGRSARHALWSHLQILLLHLLTWRYQPEQRSRSWQSSITSARQNVARRLQQPSLRPR
jgi:hypothetical protein